MTITAEVEGCARLTNHSPTNSRGITQHDSVAIGIVMSLLSALYYFLYAVAELVSQPGGVISR